MADTDFRDFLRTRHPDFVAAAQFLRPDVAKAGVHREISRDFVKLALALARRLDDSDELCQVMRKLVDTRDAAIRAALLDLYIED